MWVLFISVVLVTIAAVTMGMRPKGGRPADKTRLATMATIVLTIVLALIAVLATR
jgi:hypothetical protein